jgi:hypothetical protein
MSKSSPQVVIPTESLTAHDRDDRLRPVDFPAAGAEWSEEIPVSVNDTYGDPFIIEQVDNTISKLNMLLMQRRPIAIFTKAGPDDDVFTALRRVVNPRNVVIFYSLTGLDEGDISFDARREMIATLHTIFPNVMVFARPIIRGRNDNPENLARLVSVANELALPFVLGGVHDRHKKKQLEDQVQQHLLALCDQQGIPAFFKTSCAAAWAFGLDCWVHDLGTPKRVDIARRLGYGVDLVEDTLVLPKGTTGDINFLRMLCLAEIYIQEVVSNYNVLTLPLREGIMMEATSSWLVWSENIETCLDCDYCIIKQIEYLRRKRVSVGVHPSRLLEVVDHDKGHYALSGLRGTKLDRRSDLGSLHRYANLRITTPCHAHQYKGAGAR